MTLAIADDQALALAQEIFAAMIDGEEGLVFQTSDPGPYEPPIYAWIDVRGDLPLRVVLTTHVETAEAICRALLMLDEDSDVTDEDLADAFGELANVVGGNVKSLLPAASSLGFPEVTHAKPDVTDTLAQLLHLSWRGKPLTFAVHPNP